MKSVKKKLILNSLREDLWRSNLMVMSRILFLHDSWTNLISFVCVCAQNRFTLNWTTLAAVIIVTINDMFMAEFQIDLASAGNKRPHHLLPPELILRIQILHHRFPFRIIKIRNIDRTLFVNIIVVRHGVILEIIY